MPQRTVGRILVLAAVTLSVAAPSRAVAGAPSPGDRDVWITIGEPEFATVTDVFAPGPGSEILPFLPRLAASRGVLVTRLPESALEALSELSWKGLAVGGLAVGEPEEERLRILEGLLPHMPVDRPRYLMGVGRPMDIVAAVLRGIETQDPHADVNRDGTVDQSDVQLVSAALGDLP